ncbi:MAG: hypothetical protein ABFS43_20270 [Thermodesulfobacteriota bacterium]
MDKKGRMSQLVKEFLYNAGAMDGVKTKNLFLRDSRANGIF